MITANNVFLALGFVSLFELIGGTAIGSSARQFLRGQPSVTAFFLLIWGAGFGLMPLLLGAGLFLNAGMPLVFVAQVGIFVGTIAVVAFAPDELWSALETPGLHQMILGAVVVMLAAGFLALTLGSRVEIQHIIAVLIGASGVWMLASGLIKVVKDEG